jgi:hypothetical protein
MMDEVKDLIKTFESKIIYAEDVVRKFDKNEKMFSDRDSYLIRLNFELGKIAAFEFAIQEIKESQVDENAETLNDKLRDEHRPIPEEREDGSLFETMGNVFRPNIKELLQ